jgi:hypothetical protein
VPWGSCQLRVSLSEETSLIFILPSARRVNTELRTTSGRK